MSVDGKDVRGDGALGWSLSAVPPGTSVTFGLERGAVARITAVSPRRREPSPRSSIIEAWQPP